MSLPLLGAKALPPADSGFALGADLGHLGHDRQLAAKILKKRQEELERRSKLLDPRKRMYGVSHAVLDAQVAEKRATQEAVAAEEAYYAQTAAIQEHVLQTVEAMKADAQKKLQKETIEYSLANLHKGQRRELLLSCPKEYLAPAVTLPEEMLGPSSMVHFEGEAVDPARRRQVQEETAAWLKQQMAERQEREEAEKEWHRQHDARALEANQLRAHCEIASSQEAHDDKILEARTNLALAEEGRIRDRARKQREFDERLAHVDHLTKDPFMCEAFDYKVGAGGRIFDVKRTSLEEEQDVYNTNAHMILDKKRKEQAERDFEGHHHHLTLGSVAVLSAVETEKKRQQQDRLRAMVEENKKLASAKRQNDAHERKAYLSFDYMP